MHAQTAPAAVIRVHVKSLLLSHFRNYVSARLIVDESPVVLIGPNGAGKTNILEAISLLTPGRGIRRARLSDLDNEKENEAWAVSAEVMGPQGEAMLGTGRGQPEHGRYREAHREDRRQDIARAGGPCKNVHRAVAYAADGQSVLGRRHGAAQISRSPGL